MNNKISKQRIGAEYTDSSKCGDDAGNERYFVVNTSLEEDRTKRVILTSSMRAEEAR